MELRKAQQQQQQQQRRRQFVQLLIKCRDLGLPNRSVTLTLGKGELNETTTFGDLKHSLVVDVKHSVMVDVKSLFFSLNGKPLDDSTTVVSAGIPSLSTLTLHPRLLGGGGDGGSTCAESRDCYLNMYAVKKPDKVDPNEKRLSQWTTCALSFEPLNPPCVLDRLGNLFNKEPLVRSLLSKSLPKPFRHIKGLKDMITIHLSPISGSHESDVNFHCPISGLPFNGKYKFFALTKCGHVLSAKALKEIKSSACLVCHCDFEESDMISINGTEEEVSALRDRMEQDKAVKLSKDNKSKKVKQPQDLDCPAPRLSGKKHCFDVDGVDKPAAKLKVKRFKAVDVAPPNANKEVYASIFTSSRKSDFKETYSCRSLPLGRN